MGQQCAGKGRAGRQPEDNRLRSRSNRNLQANVPIAPKVNGVGIGIEEVLAVDPEAVAVDLTETIPFEIR